MRVNTFALMPHPLNTTASHLPTTHHHTPPPPPRHHPTSSHHLPRSPAISPQPQMQKCAELMRKPQSSINPIPYLPPTTPKHPLHQPTTTPPPPLITTPLISTPPEPHQNHLPKEESAPLNHPTYTAAHPSPQIACPHPLHPLHNPIHTSVHASKTPHLPTSPLFPRERERERD